MRMIEITNREMLMLKANLLSSGWSKQSVTEVVTPFDGRCCDDVLWDMTDDGWAGLLGHLNLASIATKLDRIAYNAQVAGDFKAAAIATAKLADLLPLVAKP